MLDQKRPGWYKSVDLEILNMYSCRHCIAGQLSLWHSELIPNFPIAEANGFDLPDLPHLRGCAEETKQERIQGWEYMEELWIRAILHRRKGSPC